MTNSETLNTAIAAYCCQQMYPTDLLGFEASSRFYNYWASIPESKLFNELSALIFSIGHEGLRFDPSITGVIGYHLFDTIVNGKPHHLLNDICTHWVASWLSFEDCDFTPSIPRELLSDADSPTALFFK